MLSGHSDLDSLLVFLMSVCKNASEYTGHTTVATTRKKKFSTVLSLFGEAIKINIFLFCEGKERSSSISTFCSQDIFLQIHSAKH